MSEINRIKELQNIYNRMGDALSREIYLDRLSYSISRDENILKKMINEAVRSRREWKELLEMLERKASGSSMYLFGAGIWGNILHKETEEMILWEGVIDNQPKGKAVADLAVMTLDDFIKKGYENAVIVISSHKNSQSMLQQLENAGVSGNKIINAGKVIHSLTEGAIYFDLGELTPRNPYEIFVDAGGFDGLTTKEFLKWCGGNGYSYCFEADVSNIETLRHHLAGDTNCEIIPKALWSETTVLSMHMTGNYASSVTEQIEGDNVQQIQAVALDDFARDKTVTFIKMDIEGAELEALRGAKHIIMEQHPKLAISIYHKVEDVWTIPKLLMEYYAGYKFYMRHYSFAGYDTVLYAIPQKSE